MTPRELVHAIEARGGSLTLWGDKIRASLPEDSAPGFVASIRAQREAVIEVLRQREDGLPWPSYNGGKQFRCEKCDTRFDTSAGRAWHEVNDCGGAA